MLKLEKHKPWNRKGWDSFYFNNPKWRDKDYRFADWLFDLEGILYGSVLDAGCGAGDGLCLIRSTCPSVTRLCGFDYSPAAVEAARHRIADAEIFCHNIEKPIPGTYDSVICFQVLEHLPDPERALSSLLAVTRDLLIVSVPFRNMRPDDDHAWYFDESDFATKFDGVYISRYQGNIYWVLSKVRPGSVSRLRMREGRMVCWDVLKRIWNFPSKLVRRAIANQRGDGK